MDLKSVKGYQRSENPRLLIVIAWEFARVSGLHVNSSLVLTADLAARTTSGSLRIANGKAFNSKRALSKAWPRRRQMTTCKF